MSKSQGGVIIGLLILGIVVMVADILVLRPTDRPMVPAVEKTQLTDESGVLAGEAAKRLVFYRKVNGRQIVCAEPSPDVANDDLSVVEKVLGLSGEGGGAKGGLDAKSKAQLESTANQLVERSQGLQFIRDLMFRACEASSNGLLTNDQYTQLLNFALTATVSMATIEIIKGTDSSAEQKTILLNFLQNMVSTPRQ